MVLKQQASVVIHSQPAVHIPTITPAIQQASLVKPVVSPTHLVNESCHFL